MTSQPKRLLFCFDDRGSYITVQYGASPPAAASSYDAGVTKIEAERSFAHGGMLDLHKGSDSLRVYGEAEPGAL